MNRPPLDFNQQQENTGLIARFARLAAIILEHLLALSLLASAEAKQGLRKTFFCSLFLLIALLLGFVGYLLLLAVVVLTAISSWHLTLLTSLILLALSQFVIAGLFLLLFFQNRPTAFFNLTRQELLKDIEALKRN